jgi:hypothetical protein
MGKTGFTRTTVILVLLGAASFVGAGDSRGPAGAGVRADAGAAVARPNILFAVADDMGHASAYGTRWVKTPNFDRLASKGLLFLNAYTPNAKCSPSRACILTGRNPWQLEAAANHWPYYPPKFKSWMEALGDSGYFVGFTGKGWAPGTLPPERKNIKLCFGKRPAAELYDLKTDADCVNNLAADPAHRSQVEAMREKLFSRLRQQGDPRMEGKGDVFDDYPTSNPAPSPAAPAQP